MVLAAPPPPLPLPLSRMSLAPRPLAPAAGGGGPPTAADAPGAAGGAFPARSHTSAAGCPAGRCGAAAPSPPRRCRPLPVPPAAAAAAGAADAAADSAPHPPPSTASHHHPSQHQHRHQNHHSQCREERTGQEGGCSAAAAAAAADINSSHPAPQLPLCMRPAVHVDELAAALSWKADMVARVSQLGDSLELQDGGPDEAGLLRELDWVLDDAIEAFRPLPEAAWEATSWRLLEPLVRAEAARGRDLAAWQLRLRAPVAALRAAWERRLQDRVPFQYLISSAHWHTYVLSVGPGVLIPRPETEIFPQLVSEALAARPLLAAAPWADLGTGSGAIAIAAADVLRRRNPSAEVWAVDVSPTALTYAAFNAELVLGAGGPAAAAAAAATAAGAATSTPAADGGEARQRHVRVLRGSWCGPLRAAGLAGRLGGLLSNPPYIPRCQMAGLQAEVGRHEPAGALDGGEGHGLDSLQELCSQAAEMLMPGGLIALETAGGEQADLVAQILRSAVLPRYGGGARTATLGVPGAGASSSAGFGGGQLCCHEAAVAERGEAARGVMGQGPAAAAAAATAAGAVVATQAVGVLEAAVAAAAAEAVEAVEECGAVGAWEAVEVLQDCYGVRRFVRAYRSGGAPGVAA